MGDSEDLQKKLQETWDKALKMENSGDYKHALTAWEKTLSIKLKLGITGAGDIGECQEIERRITEIKRRLDSSPY